MKLINRLFFFLCSIGYIFSMGWYEFDIIRNSIFSYLLGSESNILTLGH
jgi:hypothetical protein